MISANHTQQEQMARNGWSELATSRRPQRQQDFSPECHALASKSYIITCWSSRIRAILLPSEIPVWSQLVNLGTDVCVCFPNYTSWQLYWKLPKTKRNVPHSTLQLPELWRSLWIVPITCTASTVAWDSSCPSFGYAEFLSLQVFVSHS